MSSGGFSITVNQRTMGLAARMLTGITVRAIAHARATPVWAGLTVQIVGIDVDGEGNPVFRAFVVDADDVPDYRVTIDPRHLAGLLLLGDS